MYSLPIIGQNIKNAVIPTQLAQVRFYDPRTGKEVANIAPYDRVSSTYNNNGVNVEITGTQENVNKAINALNSFSTNEQQPVNTTNVQELYSLDVDLSEMSQESNSVQQPMIQSTTQTSNWTYIVNPKNPSKILLKNSAMDKPFSGSGLILFERNYKKNGVIEPTVILVQTQRGLFEDFGGEIDKNIQLSNETLKHNARKETLEESQNLFAILNTDLERTVNGSKMYIDLYDINNNANYRCYYLSINGIENYDVSQMFLQNKNITMTRLQYAGNEWQETINLKRFYVSTLKNALSTTSGSVNCNDINNISHTIRDRTSNCLRAIFSDPNMLSHVFNNSVNASYSRESNVYSQMNGIQKISL